MRRRLASVVCALLAACAWAAPASADPALWSLLQRGGQVVLIRHAQTEPGVGDPPGMLLSDCATQRNLSEAGRAEAAQLGAAFRSRGVPVGQLASSPWCRCLETARLAFGRAPEIAPALGNLFGRGDPGGRQLAQLKELVTRLPVAGNRVLVSHGSTIVALTGVSPQPGELVIVTPQPEGRFVVAGRMLPGER
jgi:phosphohistidine phosphatase SixA